MDKSVDNVDNSIAKNAEFRGIFRIMLTGFPSPKIVPKTVFLLALSVMHFGFIPSKNHRNKFQFVGLFQIAVPDKLRFADFVHTKSG